MKSNRNGLKNRKKAMILSVIGVMGILSVFLGLNVQFKESYGTEQYAYVETTSDSFQYLSDLDYITTDKWSYVSWGEIKKDQPPEGTYITLIVDGHQRIFAKGMGMHADSQLTYDISELSDKYTRFISKAGVDNSRGTNGSVFFKVLVSNDGTSWTEIYRSSVVTGASEAIDIDVNIAGYKYLRIFADKNGSNAADHAVLGNAKLAVEDYEEPGFIEYTKLHDLDYYDEILSSHDADYNYASNYRLVLEREVVRKIGYDNIQNMINIDEKVAPTLDWLTSSDENLELAIEVGELTNGAKFLTVLSDLYTEFKGELTKEDADVYKKMLFGQAAAYSTDNVASPLTFSHKTPTYDYIERFRVFKEMYDERLFLYSNGFKEYHVEFFRIMMQDGARTDEMRWLNYIGKAKNYATGVYSYVPYISPNYSMSAKPHLYDIANKDTYEAKYHLEEYGVPFADNTTRYWMVMEAGGICWNQARFIQAVFRGMGRPSIGVYQPSHEAALYYIAENADGTGMGTWNIAGNIFGWGSTSNQWYGGNRTRTLFNWAGKSFTNQVVNANGAGTSAGYIYLAQANLNNYDAYKKSLYYNLIANSYSDTATKVEIYKESLEINDINLDTYDYMIQAYKSMDASSEEWYELALEIIDNYTYYPMAMNDLLKLIKPYLNGVHKIDIDQKEYNALLRAQKATANDNWQWSACQSIANAILKKTNGEFANFSFDGANAGKIILSSDYDTFTDIQWHYSVDGGATKSVGTTEHSVQLTRAEIEKITAEDDIKIYVDGLPGDALAYTIDIQKGTVPADTLYANDLENRVVGVNLTYEWRNSETDAWTSYATASPNNTGDKTLYVRVGATGVYLPSDSVTFNFTTDTDTPERKYIPVSHLSIHAVSTEATANAGSATYAIDGNYNTRWHSAWNGTDTERYITVKLDAPVILSAVEFVPAGGGNGKIYDGTIYGSMDGETWEVLTQKTGLTYTNQANTIADAIANTKSFDIEAPKQVQYVMIKADRTNGNWFTARAFNFYQDISGIDYPTASIGYSTTEPTNGEVVARLINPSTENFKITNNGGSDTYVFTENGDFTFEFIDTVTDKKGSVTANVTWIDKTAPTATIEYNTTSATNKVVTATLKPSEDVIVTNNGDYEIDDDGNITDKDGNVLAGYTVDRKGNVYDEKGNLVTNMNAFTHDFITNGYFTFEFMDYAGNRGSAKAEVTWIDTDIPDGVLTYDITGLTNKDVTVSIELDEADAYVTNNGGKKTYTFTENGTFTFEFRDPAGNANHVTATVDWIDKTAPTALLKYEKTSDKVIVRVIEPSEEITFATGNGVYEFDKNGRYDIVFYDKAGNAGKVTAIIEGLASSSDGDNSNDGDIKDDDTTGDREDGDNNDKDDDQNNTTDVDNNNDYNAGNTNAGNANAGTSSNTSNKNETGDKIDVEDSSTDEEDSDENSDEKDESNDNDKSETASKDETSEDSDEDRVSLLPLYIALGTIALVIIGGIIVARKKND